jgi:hypothetical protein
MNEIQIELIAERGCAFYPPTTTHRNWLGTPIGFNLIGFALNSGRWLFARPLLQRRGLVGASPTALAASS